MAQQHTHLTVGSQTQTCFKTEACSETKTGTQTHLHAGQRDASFLQVPVDLKQTLRPASSSASAQGVSLACSQEPLPYTSCVSSNTAPTHNLIHQSL